MALPADLDVRPGRPGRPIVFLLHGTGGTRAHMDDAGSTGFNHDYAAPFPPDRDVGERAYPGIGVWSFALDPLKQVRSWQEFLSAHGYGTVTYSQDEPRGLLARPVEQLEEVVRHVMDRERTAPLVLLGHSRGGVLIRKFLADHQGEATSRISAVITLHSSHAGNRLALFATAVNSAVEDLKSVVGPDGRQAIDAALGWLVDIVNAPAFGELAEGSAFLEELAQDETALPGVAYHTFGGTSVLFTRVLAWVYTLASAVPRWRWPPFQHTITMVEVPGISPVANSLPNLTDEITEGRGDILVADDTATLPFAVHRTNSLNHAEALWDPALQLQVLALLEGQGGIWS